ncbi:MAG: glycine/sarcosine/betaine reductase selenoprotein B family protein, partial [Enterococcus gallinarum]|nr:glycine/sarcosine/betaine reductase selenoprotein B family protein [Enterococcus gallinarum]
MKIIFLLDQIQAGLGGKEHGDQPLGGQKTAIGSVKMFEKLLKEKNMEVLATIYCGDDYYRKHAKESSLKIAAMVQKLGADVLLCGPCFNYETYGEMAAEVAKVVEEKVQI